MFHIVLFEPEIPQNTGNIIRLCANTGCHLHLIEPLGFAFNSAKMRRAGLDYHEFTSVARYIDWQDFTQKHAENTARIFAFTTHGALDTWHNTAFQAGDIFLFGSESRGLPIELRQSLAPEHLLRLPMQAQARSLNLSNAVAVAIYQAWGQQNFMMN